MTSLRWRARLPKSKTIRLTKFIHHPLHITVGQLERLGFQARIRRAEEGLEIADDAFALRSDGQQRPHVLGRQDESHRAASKGDGDRFALLSINSPKRFWASTEVTVRMISVLAEIASMATIGKTGGLMKGCGESGAR